MSVAVQVSAMIAETRESMLAVRTPSDEVVA
jgi:hypothetical protein